MKNLYRSVNPLFIFLLTLSLTACSFFDGRRSKDTEIEVRGSLEVPPDLARPGGPELAIPQISAHAPVAKPAGSPTATPAIAAKPNVKLERAGSQRWLSVQDEPARVWLSVREYFLRNKIPVATENPTTGILETDWIDRPVTTGGGLFGSIIGALSSTGLRDKFRIRIEAGRVAGTTEIYVSHQGLEEIVSGSDGSSVVQRIWQPRASDPEAEAEQLAKLMQHLGVDTEQAKTQLAAGAADLTQIEKGKLVLTDGLEDAWRRVGTALGRVGATIEDRDRSSAIYYIRYIDTEVARKSSGLFSWLKSDSAAERDKKESVQDRFQVRLQAEGDGTSVVVLNIKGEPEETGTGARLLGILNQQLH